MSFSMESLDTLHALGQEAVEPLLLSSLSRLETITDLLRQLDSFDYEERLKDLRKEIISSSNQYPVLPYLIALLDGFKFTAGAESGHMEFGIESVDMIISMARQPQRRITRRLSKGLPIPTTLTSPEPPGLTAVFCKDLEITLPNFLSFIEEFIIYSDHRGIRVFYNEEAFSKALNREENLKKHAAEESTLERIERLPRVSVSGMNEMCIIYREDMAEGEVTQLLCKHSFHPECISSWLLEKEVCPWCRRSISKSRLWCRVSADGQGGIRRFCRGEGLSYDEEPHENEDNGNHNGEDDENHNEEYEEDDPEMREGAEDGWARGQWVYDEVEEEDDESHNEEHEEDDTEMRVGAEDEWARGQWVYDDVEGKEDEAEDNAEEWKDVDDVDEGMEDEDEDKEDEDEDMKDDDEDTEDEESATEVYYWMVPARRHVL